MPAPPVLFGPEYLAVPRPASPWIIRSLLPRNGFLLVNAPPKQGKTTAVLQMVEAIATPMTPAFVGLGIHEHGPVGILQLDTPPDLWKDEYVKPMSDAGLDFSNVAFLDRADLPLGLFPFNIRSTAALLWLQQWVAAFHPIAVVVDSYRNAFQGEERDSGTTMEVVSNLQKAITPAALVLIHHNRKPGVQSQPASEESLVEEGRGSTALPATADVIWRVSRKRWTLVGRGGDARIDVVFDPETGMISPKNALTADLVSGLRTQHPDYSDRALARRITELCGLPFETCRNWLKRNPQKPTQP